MKILSASIIIPTRSRAKYLHHALRSCTRIQRQDIEIIVLDNSSSDDTYEVVENAKDCRVKYFRSPETLSMSKNFERGIELAGGKFLAFMGDDDAIFANAVDRAIALADKYSLKAVISNHSRYYWPDTPSKRRNLCLTHSKSSVKVYDSSRNLLKSLPASGNYMHLPCAYYGFVQKELFMAIIEKQKKFFVSNQPDVYSTIALSMEDISFAYDSLPLFVAGVSRKSNGGRCTSPAHKQEYLDQWKKEDDVGFLPGFESWQTINSVILEQGLIYCKYHNKLNITDVFTISSIKRAILMEITARKKNKLTDAEFPVGHYFPVEALPPANANPFSTLNLYIFRLLSGLRTLRNTRFMLFTPLVVSNVAQVCELLSLPLPLAYRKANITAPIVNQLRALLKML